MMGENLSSEATKSQKSILVLNSRPGNIGGSGRAAVALANALVQDYKVHYLCVYGQDEEQFFPLDRRISRMTLLPRFERMRFMMAKIRKPLKRYLRENDISVVLVVENYQGASALLTTITTKGTSFVFCDHGALASQWGDFTVRTIRRLCARFYDAVVTLTQQSRQDYITRFHMPSFKVRAIPNWIDPALLARQSPYDSEAKTLLWAGRLEAEKGVDYLLQIASRVLPSRPEWQWHIYGAGRLEEHLLARIGELGLSRQLILQGFAPDLYDVYPNYGVVTLTSEREGLPMVLLEGKACGIPLIGFDVTTGPREIIDDGVDGYLVKPFDVDEYADKLGTMMDDPHLRLLMSEHAHEDIERFSEKSVYAQWRALIEDLSA